MSDLSCVAGVLKFALACAPVWSPIVANQSPAEVVEIMNAEAFSCQAGFVIVEARYCAPYETRRTCTTYGADFAITRPAQPDGSCEPPK